jgi:hypothetical protein
MRTTYRMIVMATLVAGLAVVGQASGSGQVFSYADVVKNRAIAASPRAREEFPWLTRQSATPASTAKRAESHTALSEVKKNRALAASPRMLEQFPELSRSVQASGKSTEDWIPSSVLKNRALAASPRMREEFPWLARGGASKSTEEKLEIAPVK